MTLDGAFTNLEVTSTSWDALQWLHPAECASRATNINVFIFLLNRFITFLSSSFFYQLFLRYDVSQGEWVRCNMHIQKMCHYPVFGLKEGSLYQFRVCAVNKAGVGRPSKASEPVCTADPLKHTRTAGTK